MDLVLVSEREAGSSWEDCVWSTGVMVGNVAFGENRFPATRSEYEGLRFDATGIREAEGDGSNYRELEAGLTKRYGLAPRRGSGWSNLVDVTPIGAWAATQILYSSMGSYRLTSFGGGHSFIWRRSSVDHVELYDPLAANGAKPRSVPLSTIRRAYEALAGAEWISVYEWEAWRQSMFVLNLERWHVPAGTKVFDNPNGAQVTTFSSAADVTTLGYPTDRSADHVDWGWRAVLVTTKAVDGVSAPKVAFIRRPVGNPLPTDAAWDAAVASALRDPSFRGGSVIHAAPTELLVAEKKGVHEGIVLVDQAVERLKSANP